MPPDPAELVHPGSGADGREVVDEHVPANRGVVAENAVVADVTVVRHVRVGHEHVAFADRRLATAPFSAAVNRHELTEDVAMADGEVGLLAFEFEVLWDESDRRERKDLGLVADVRIPVHHGRCADAASSAKPNVLADYGVRADD